MIIAKIVLTGGPCAGKTTALARIEQEFTELGYKVFIVSESATELINSGVRPFGDMAIDLVEFQKIIFKYQLAKEEVYAFAAEKLQQEKIIIIYDRSLIDNKSYVSSLEFDYILKSVAPNMTMDDLYNRYDKIIHLVTAADGAIEAYTLSNNTARTESATEAIIADDKIKKVYLPHPNKVIIDNSSDFKDKINRVLAEIYNYINEPIPTRRQKHYSVNIDNSSLESLSKSSIISHIKQIYLTHIPYEERLREVIIDGNISYYHTKQKKLENGKSEIIFNRKITPKEYQIILNNSDFIDYEEKTRYSFVSDNQYYRLDIYSDGYMELELDLTTSNSDVKIPSIFSNITEIKDRTKTKKRIPD